MAVAFLTLRAQMAARFDASFEIRQHPNRPRLRTGIPAVDRLLEGGLPKATLTEISGGPSTGRTALAFSILSNATRDGESCVWVDAAGSFDPAAAAETGALLEKLLWVDCGGNALHALQCTDLLIQAGGFGLVVLDLGDTPPETARRIPLASWFRLRHAAERTGSALLALGLQVNARSCSALQIEMRRKETLWRGLLLKGIDAAAESRRHQLARAAEFTAVR